MFPQVTTGNLRFQPSEKHDEASTVIHFTCSNNPLKKIENTDEPTITLPQIPFFGTITEQAYYFCQHAHILASHLLNESKNKVKNYEFRSFSFISCHIRHKV